MPVIDQVVQIGPIIIVVAILSFWLRAALLARRLAEENEQERQALERERMIVMWQTLAERNKPKHDEPERTFAGIGDDGEMIFAEDKRGETSDTL